jgi:streptogramin lyase
MKRIRIGALGITSALLALGGLSVTLPNSVFAQAPSITEYTAPSTLGTWGGIAKGPDGNVWFSEYNGNKIGKITPSGTVTEFSTGLTASAGVYGITAGPDGNLWFTEAGVNKIGKITTSGTITEYAAGGTPYQITAGSDGNLWYTEPNSNAVVKMTISGTATPYTVPTSSAAVIGIATGSDGNVWVAERDANKIAKVTPSGTFTEYTVPTSNAQPIGMAPGPDGNMWFSETNTSKVAYVTPSGTFSELATPTSSSSPYYMTTGADGNVWFLEMAIAANKVGKVVMPSAPTASGQTVSVVTGGSITVNTLTGATNNPDPSTVTIDSGPSHGTATVNKTTGAITYTPNAGYIGADSLSFIVCSLNDSGICSADPVLTFNVTATTPDTGYGKMPAKRLQEAAGLVASLVLVAAGIGIRRKYSRS